MSRKKILPWVLAIVSTLVISASAFAGQCTKDIGASCRMDIECDSGLCAYRNSNQGNCVASSLKDAGGNCEFDEECKSKLCVYMNSDKGYCVERRDKNLGEQCDVDAECASCLCGYINADQGYCVASNVDDG